MTGERFLELQRKASQQTLKPADIQELLHAVARLRVALALEQHEVRRLRYVKPCADVAP